MKTKKSDVDFFKNISPEDFVLWSVHIKDTLPGDYVVRLSEVDDDQKRQLLSTELLSDLYPRQPGKGHIHIIIEKKVTAVDDDTSTKPPSPDASTQSPPPDASTQPPSPKLTKRAADTLEEPSQDSDSCVEPGPSTKKARISFVERLESDLEEIGSDVDSPDEEAEPSATPEELSQKWFDTHRRGMELLDRLTTKKLYWSDRIFDLIADGISQSERSRVEKYMDYLRQAEKDTDQIVQWLRYMKHLAGCVGNPSKVYKGRQSEDDHTSFLENPF
ncbi:hypothetical protein BGX28_000785 [Mortierella sp. GBA30]|nr:hypothetical protein BGX28_000785 [Mortierella sp. GBA30]